jgi:ArsR family transcriptional regulator, arsenate/arsenite/antimonite-responsive transcriptional repressor / arsenate reductase (thioredoxin)
MAEALLEHLSGGGVSAASAGSHPKALHPAAIRAMREYGIDISGNQVKHIDAFAGQHFDYVISLCDRVREVCPEFPGHPAMIHWSIPDPAGPAAGDGAFHWVAADLRSRIGFLLARLGEAAPTLPAA